MASQDTVSVKYEADLSKLQKDYDKLIADNVELKRRVDGVTKEYDQLGKKAPADIKKVEKETEKLKKSGGGLKSTMAKIGPAIAAAFAVDKLISIGKEIINVTGKFQRYAAVLENTLGSKSQAQSALLMIQKFASETPFSVDELTSSFVKLANQGFKPTRAEMTKLGDLAASQGKTFDMLTEAIIDAQTGEFERLKEFGIRASKQGDEVKFTFKGVETQTDFTADAIRAYVLQLGELEGVSGGMVAISQTLEGQISNLGDAWDSFLLSLGGIVGGGSGGLIGAVSDSLSFLGDAIRRISDPFQYAFDEAKKVADEFQSQSLESAKAYTNNLTAIQVQGEIDRLNTMIAIRYAAYIAAESENDTRAAKLAADQVKLYQSELAALKEILESKETTETKAEEKRKQDLAKNADKLLRAREKAEQDLLKMAFDAQQMRIDNMEDGIDKELLLLNLKYEKEKNQFRDNKAALLEIEKKYQADIESLQIGEVEAEVARQELAAKNAKEFTDSKNKADEDELLAEIANQERQQQVDRDFAARKLEDQRVLSEGRIQVEQSTFAALNSLGQIFIEDQQRLAEFQKALTLFQIGIDTARAISSVIAAAASTSITPIDLAIKVAAGIGTVLANIATAKTLLSSSTVPAFAEGVVDLQGPGTGKSDSILSRLSKGESVIKAEKTKAYKKELEAMNYGDYEGLILQKYVMPALREDRKQRDTASNMVSAMKLAGLFDDSGIISTLERNKPATSKDINRLNKDLQKTFKTAAYKQSKFWKN